MAGPLAVDIRRSLDALDEGEWRGLVSRCADPTVFQDLGWLRAWCATCAPEGAEPCVLTVRSGSRLAGAAPLLEGRSGTRSGAPEAGLRFIGDPHSDYNQFLVEDDAAEVYAALGGALDAEVRRVGRAVLSDIPSHVGTAKLLLPLAGRLGRVAVSGRVSCPRLDFLKDGAGAALLARASFRRHAAKLRRAGPVVIEHLQDASAIRARLPSFFDQHVRRWQATPYPSLFLGAHNRALYDRLLDELPGRVLFTVVTVGGRPAAYHYGFLSGEDLLWYKPSFEVELSEHSPGLALLYSLVEWCVEQGRTGLDFTRGDEAFKGRYANEVRENRSLALYPTGVRRLEAEIGTLSRRAVGKIARLVGPSAGEVAS